MATPEPDRTIVDLTEAPPHRLLGILQRLGPGLIVAGSIVGSGELIATTKTGAAAGFWLLWLILIGCVIKVFVQVEFGRYSLVTGETTMVGLAEVPGPRIRGRGNWIVWYWLLMFLASIGQLGGIVGGVGQALAISVPLTEAGRDFNAYVDDETKLQVARGERHRALQRGEPLATLDRRIAEAEQRLAGKTRPATPPDDKLWAALIAVVTSVLLMLGRYRLIQAFSTAMVSLFTLITVINLGLLQSVPVWAVSLDDIVRGMSFRLPPAQDGDVVAAVSVALATFGIIGVGASELVTYPYWCLEKGYARFTGPRDTSQAWADRARGWLRVMKWDAWCSMVVYTFATVAFYLLGAATLGRTGLNPGKDTLVRTLAVMYEPVFATWAQALFLFGAFAVLYSTYFVANASHARVFSDVLRVVGLIRDDAEIRRRMVRILSGVFPLLCLVVYVFFPKPATLVLLSGVMQAFMLPMLAAAGLFFRYRRSDPRLNPGRVWDLFLWLSAVGMLIAGVWALVSNVLSVL